MTTRSLVARLALASVCVMPIADLALSDAASIWVLRHADASVGQGGGIFGRIVEDALVGGFIFSGSVLLAWPVTRMRRLQGVVDGFDAYQEARRASMPPWRAAISRAVNAPFAALGLIAERVERVGLNVAGRDSESRVRTSLARWLVDFGQVNAIGTTAVAMQETITQELPVTMRRIVRLSLIIAASWLATAEIVRGIYAGASVLGPFGAVIRAPLQFMGAAFDLLTGISLSNPFSTPVAFITLAAIAVALAVTGWNVARFHESQLILRDGGFA